MGPARTGGRGPRDAGAAINRWGGTLAVGWAALALLVFAQSLWEMPTYLEDAFPGLYGPIRALLPAAWITAPRLEGWGRVLASFFYLLLALGLWAGYVAAMRAVGRAAENRPHAAAPGALATGAQDRRLLTRILGWTLLFSGFSLAWPGLFASDLYLYAAHAKMQAVYGLNPLVQAPAQMANDPWRDWLPWPDIHSAYGPFWHDFTWLVGTLAQGLGGDRVLYLLGFRLLGMLLLLAGAGLVWDIGGRLVWSPTRRAAATLLWAWCPLVQIDGVANGHNDVLLAVCILAAIWLHLRGAWPLTVAALTLAGLVKLPGAFLLPAYGVWLLRSSPGPRMALRRLGTALAVGAGVALLAYAPYADPRLGPALLDNPVAGQFASSPAATLRQALIDGALALRGRLTSADLTDRQMIGALRWPLWYGCTGLWLVLAGWLSLRVRDLAGLLRAWTLVLLTFLVIGAVWLQPWYILWLVPLLALLPASRLRTAGLLLAFGGTITYAFGPVFPGDMTPNLRHYYVPAAIFLPLLLYCAHAGWRALAGHAVKGPHSTVNEGGDTSVTTAG